MRRLPLLGKVLLVAFLNLCLLGAVITVLVREQFRLDAGTFLLSPVQNRIMTMAHALAMELDETPAGGWDGVLARYSQANHVNLCLIDEEGEFVAGQALEMPPEVADRIPQRGRGTRQRRDREKPGRRAGGMPPLFLTATDRPSGYWAGVRIPVRVNKAENPKPGTLILMSPTLMGTPLFFDARPWMTVGGAVILVSLMCWVPFVWALRRSIQQMTLAVERATEGRLSGLLSAQKRFLGGIAHELCNPIATIQFALGSLERRVGAEQRVSVEEIQEEVQHMSDLVNELLSFSRAGIQGAEVKLEPVNLAATVARVLAREGGHVDVAVDERLNVLAEPEYLFRAISNVVRNAIRYAGHAGPIHIGARSEGGRVYIAVSDQGPGVPPNETEEIFAPFYRLDPSRNQQTGGFGLGLAIVKACIESCKGTVRCRNRQPSGLEVELELGAAEDCKGLAKKEEIATERVF